MWDIEKGSESASCEEHKQLIQDIVWDHEGKVWATSSKDKKLRLGDPRSKSIVGEIDQAHAGAKSTKLSFLGGFDRLCSVGFTKQSQRQIKFWDVKKLGAISASRRVETPSRHRRASSPGMMEVGGFFFDFEAVRTVSSEYDAPRRSRRAAPAS